MTRWLATVAGIGLLSCAGPFEVRDREPWSPPAEYVVMYDTIRTCTNSDQSYAAVRWYTGHIHAPDVCPRGCTGVWIAPDEIVLNASVYRPADQRAVARHELVHYALQQPHHEGVFLRCANPGPP